MPNVGGSNQFGSYQIQPGYGDVKKQTELLKEAPISGAPLAAHALETARRSGKQAKRGGQQQAAPVPAPAPPPAPPAQATPFVVAQRWAAIAAIPGANDAIQYMAQKAASGQS